MSDDSELKRIVIQGIEAAMNDETYSSIEYCPYKDGSKEWYWWSTGYDIYPFMTKYENNEKDYTAH